MHRVGLNRGAFARLAVLLVCGGSALGLASAAGANQATTAKAPAAGTSGRVTGVPGTAGLAAPSGVRAIGTASPNATVTTEIFMAGRSAALAASATSVSTPGSDDYQHFLTPAQVQATFGATPAQLTAVEHWLQSAGLRVDEVSAQEITATGTTAQTEAAYDTTLERYSDSTGSFTAPSTAATLPASVAGSILSVLGLSTRPQIMRPAALDAQRSAVPSDRGNATAAASTPTERAGTTYLGSPNCSSYFDQLTDTTDPQFNGAQQDYQICGYLPSQMRSAYGVTQGDGGKGVTVAVVDAYSNPTLEADANEYATNHGEPDLTPGQFSVTTDSASWTNESGCGGPSGWAGEQALDIEAVHAMAPASDIAYFGANSCFDDDFIATLTDIINNHLADVITDSWGEPIYDAYGNVSSATMAAYSTLFEDAAMEGIEVSFSSGDCGADSPSTGCAASDGSNRAQPDFPDSDPWVTAVGGTSTEIGQSGTVQQVLPWGTDYSILNGVTWAPDGWTAGGGGGTSYDFAQPSYQSGVVPTSLAETELDGSTSTTPMRVVPDLALDANPGTGFLIGFTQPLPAGGTGYAETDYGGTSLASPLFAGLVADGISDGALARGFLNPTLYDVYSHGGSRFFDDVVDPAAGDNPAQILDGFNSRPTEAFTLASDRPLTAVSGYDNATGLGMPTAGFLSLADTATTLSSSQSTVITGAAVKFTARVTVPAQSASPGGEVQFYVDGVATGAPVAVSAGTATSDPDTGLSVGSHKITAAYVGDSTQGLLPSTSTALSETVNASATHLSDLTLSGVAPLTSNGQVGATLARTDTGAAVPGQTVSFTSGGTALCSATTNAQGVASCGFPITSAVTASLFASGYQASFAGSTDYLTSTAGAGLPADVAIALPVTTALGSANHTASVTLSCISNASGCSATAQLYAASGNLLGTGSFTLASGQTRTGEIKLNQLGQRLTNGNATLGGHLTVISVIGSGPSQTNSYSVTVKPLKRSLLAAVPSGQAASAARSAGKALSVNFTALFAGRLSVALYESVAGKRHAKPRLERVATGGNSFGIAGAQTVVIAPTHAGARLLRRSGRLRLTAKISFVPVGERAVTTTTRFRL